MRRYSPGSNKKNNDISKKELISVSQKWPVSCKSINMIIRFISLIFLILGPLEKGQAKSCFTKHIKESIKINQESSKFYKELTDGESDQIYKRLIAGEKASLKIAQSIDKQVQLYHQHGIDLLCQEFKDMIPFEPSLKDSQFPDVAPLPLKYFSFYKQINKAIKTNDENIIRSEALKILNELHKSPSYHCFSRHIIESIYRFAYYIPIRKKQSEDKNLNDPKKILIKVIKLQLLALPFAQPIDRLTIPIQKQGISMLCHELPNLIEDIHLEELNILKKHGKNYGKN